MIDKSFIGHSLGRRTLNIEEGAVRFYAKAIGETDPVYTDLDAARAAGVPRRYLVRSGHAISAADAQQASAVFDDLRQCVAALPASPDAPPVDAPDGGV